MTTSMCVTSECVRKRMGEEVVARGGLVLVGGGVYGPSGGKQGEMRAWWRWALSLPPLSFPCQTADRTRPVAINPHSSGLFGYSALLLWHTTAGTF